VYSSILLKEIFQ